jgi:hypothetical protein
MNARECVLVVGNSPSSGSSLLGVLLDSTPISSCGPELNLFTSYRLFKDYSGYKKNPFRSEYSPSIYIQSNALNSDRLVHYAMSKSSYRDMVNVAHDANELVALFSERYCGFRGKKGAIWVEKTPQNISNLSKIQLLDNIIFLHIVRNPLYVISSLVKRGMRIEIAALTWLFEVSHYITHSNEKCFYVKYENLVASPWQTVSSILAEITDDTVSPEEVEHGYKNNYYRKIVSRKSSSWEYSQHGEIGNANKKILDKASLSVAKEMTDYKLSSEYSSCEGVVDVSFMDAVEYFDYKNEVMGALDNVKPSNVLVKFAYKTRLRLIRKNIRKNGAWSFGKKRSFDWRHNPIERLK